jgi:microcystin-dependent protein
MDAFIGEIRSFSFDYPPVGWLDCDGTVYQIAQFPALAALLSNTFGGDGQRTFGVPDMRVRTPFGTGYSDFGTPFSYGTYAGFINAQITNQNMPAHGHSAMFMPTNPVAMSASVTVLDSAASAPGPKNNYLAISQGVNTYASPGSTPTATLGGTSASLSGAGTVKIDPAGATGTPAVFSTQPSLVAVRICICVEGEFPTKP